MATKTRRLADLLANIDDNSKVTSAGLLDATITATDLAPNSVDSSELVDGAIDTSHLGDLQVTAGKVAADAVTTAKVADNAVTGAKIAADTIPVKPHIQPGKLYPAWKGLLEGHGAESQYFTDSSASARTIRMYDAWYNTSLTSSRSMEVHHSGVQKKVGNSSIRFNGLYDALICDDSGDWDFGTGSATIEMWFYPTKEGTQRLVSCQGGSNYFILWFGRSGRKISINTQLGTEQHSSTDLALNTWHHVALVKDGTSTTKIYVNGAEHLDATTHDGNWPDAAAELVFGRYQDDYSEAFQGYMDDIRITKGLAVYTGAFTPQTTALATTWSAGTGIAANSTASNVKLLIHSNISSSLIHSGDYGTAQSDGKSYYFTNIKGSGKIDDPRIGAYFGSQRHRFTSFQIDEQATAAENAQKGGGSYVDNAHRVLKIDGRDWCRAAGGNWRMLHNGHGLRPFCGNASTYNNMYIEITGYFNKVDLIQYTDSNHRMYFTVDGGNESGTPYPVFAGGAVTLNRNTPSGSVANFPIDESLGIHTIKLRQAFAENDIYGVDLTAHGKFTDATCDTNHTSGLGSPASTSKITMDSTAKVVAGMSVTGVGIAAGTTVSSVDSATVLTLSAATTATNSNQTLTFGVSDIVFPAQNVVSYGKKFAISETAQHYNPFAAAQNGTAVAIGNAGSHGKVTGGWSGTGANYYDSTLDTATSLGLAAWVNGGNYYRPVNGGRVTKWVASDGTIKTSVNMMPPAATGMGDHSGSNSPIAHNWPVQVLPIFRQGMPTRSQEELAKTYNWREFGNGSNNEGENTSGARQDLSRLNAVDDVTFVMEDGLTHMSGDNAYYWQNYDYLTENNKSTWITFIGTGFSFSPPNSNTGNRQGVNLVEGLPYGTHVIRVLRADSSTYDGEYFVDGVTMKGHPDRYPAIYDMSIHQPKRPPIPEDAVVLADYMLMADFVPNQVVTATHEVPSKGTRRCNALWDHLYYENSGTGSYTVNWFHGTTKKHTMDYSQSVGGSDNVYVTLSSFCTNFVSLVYQSRTRHKLYINDVNKPHGSGANQDNGGNWGSYGYLTTDAELGHNIIRMQDNDVAFNIGDTDLATPTHTVSHYQTFETPHTRDLLGGDRNMEQTNLIVSPEGTTWDEYTRDTSYMGNMRFQATSSAGDIDSTQVWHPDTLRGSHGNRDLGVKDFAYAHAVGGLTCLVAGHYIIGQRGYSTNTVSQEIKVNGVLVLQHNHHSGGSPFEGQVYVTLDRGDVITFNSPYASGHYGDWWIWKQELSETKKGRTK